MNEIFTCIAQGEEEYMSETESEQEVPTLCESKKITTTLVGSY